MNTLSGIWRLLTPRERRRCVYLQALSLLMAFATVAGVAAVMPFFAVLGDPTLIERNAALRELQDRLGPGDPQPLTLVLGGGFIGLLLLSSLVNLAGSVALGRFAYRIGDRLRTRLFAGYLGRDYEFHASRAGAVLASRVLYQADRVTGLLQSAFTLVSNLLVIVLMVASIAVVDAYVASTGLLVFGVSYALIYAAARRRLMANGQRQARAGIDRIAVVEQSLAGIKDVLVSHGQAPFIRRYATACTAISRAVTSTQAIGLAPRYLLECLAGITLIAAALILAGRSTTSAWLGELTFIAAAGYRLLPAVQQCYFSLATVRANQVAWDDMSTDLAMHEPIAAPGGADAPRDASPPSAVELVDVTFGYGREARRIVEGVSLRIDAGSVVAFVGPNGSGKTTTADLMLGLLTPTSGRIDVDGQTLSAANRAAWQRQAAYVPQQVFILDASVRDNIALGVEPASIDDAALRRAARMAGAHAFIEQLPGQYAARLGTRGASLSGGQRQRIGLARALYRSPTFLVLDEATSSLDESSAQVVANLLHRLRGQCTVVVITHHADIVAACDRCCEFRGGRVIACRTIASTPLQGVS